MRTEAAPAAGRRTLHGQRTRRLLWDGVVFVLLLGRLVIVLFPFVWMISTSLKPLSATFTTKIQLIPAAPLWDNYIKVWRIFPFGVFYMNSVIVSGTITLLQLLLCSLAAYAFSRLQWPGRDAVFLVYLAAMMIPSQVTLIPNFLFMRILGGIDRYWGIIVPQVFTVFGVFLLRQFFTTIPASLQEAALMDGCSHLRIYARIIMPLATPGLAALGVFSFMFSWNNFLWPLVVAYRESMFTLPIGLLSFRGQFSTDFPLMMAAACQAMLPVLILYAIAQKRFVEGITLTGLAN
jgi:multiple sugar transport system permease protein